MAREAQRKAKQWSGSIFSITAGYGESSFSQVKLIVPPTRKSISLTMSNHCENCSGFVMASQTRSRETGSISIRSIQSGIVKVFPPGELLHFSILFNTQLSNCVWIVYPQNHIYG